MSSAEDNNPAGKRMTTTNSLLNAASLSFSFSEDSALLVPVALDDEPTLFGEPASSEIDLNSDDIESSQRPPSIQSATIQSTTISTGAASTTVLPSNLNPRIPPPSPASTRILPPAISKVDSNESVPLFVMDGGSGESKFKLFPSGGSEFLTQDWGNILSPPTKPQLPPPPIGPPPSSQSHSFPPSSMMSNSPRAPPPPVSTIVQEAAKVTLSSPTNISTTTSPYTIQSQSYQNNGSTEMEMESQSKPPPMVANMGSPTSPGGPPLSIGSPGATSPRENSFRLGNQRPTYAQYPGLSGTSPQTQAPIPAVMPMSTPFGVDTVQPSPVPMSTFSPLLPEPLVSFPASSLNSSPHLPDGSNNNNGQVHFRPAPPQYSTSPTMGYQSQQQYPTQQTAPTTTSPVMQYHQHQGGYYKALTFHWFHRKGVKKEVEVGEGGVGKDKAVWRPFSVPDSTALEKAFVENDHDLVSTDGGRYDVNVHKRLKCPVYWEEDVQSEVRRCSWFYKGPMDSRFVPYEEDLSNRLEDEYNEGIKTGIWNRRLEFPGLPGEAIILYNPTAMSHFCQAAAPDEWGNLPESQLRPRVVKRGVEEFEIEDGESSQIDHLVFLVHGIGSICDFKLRTIVEAVDDFRHLSFQLMQTHFKDAVDSQRAGRIEFLPVSWHKALHGDGGIDQRLKPITLKSIPKLRNFTNDTLLDILFYTSPVYAQTIIDTVGNELNRLFNLFLSRNPTFNGYVAVAGHSLGSLILFDLLAHQPKIGRYTKDSENQDAELRKEDEKNEMENPTAEASSRLVSYTIGSGTGQPLIKYPTLEFEPTAFFALGSPIAMFVTVRGIDRLGENFHFPTCPAFFNIFHPYDPVAYRLETLIDPTCDMRPVLIPHHKGRKRFHLELKETMQRVGADLKQKFLDSLKTTWNTVYQYATFSKGDNFEQEIDRVIEGEFGQKSVDTNSNGSADDADQDIGLGKLNGGRRVDYVLQEAPLESFNEYLFALSSHVTYWESEDTMLMVLREIYASMGIFVEKQSQAEQQFSTNLPSGHGSSGAQYPNEPPMNIGCSYTGGLYNPQSPSEPPPLLFGNPPPATTFLNNSSTTQAQPPPPPLFMNPSPTSAGQSFTNPPPLLSTTSSTSAAAGKPTVIGARPVVSADAIATLRGGWDPTAPINSTTTVGPPPLTGFQRK